MAVKEAIKEVETYIKKLKKEEKLSKVEAEVANLILKVIRSIK